MLNTPVAVFGLESMGLGMAQSLMRAGLPNHGFDIDPQPMRRFQDQGGSFGELGQVIATVDAAIVVVLNAALVESMRFGETGKPRRYRMAAWCSAAPPYRPNSAGRWLRGALNTVCIIWMLRSPAGR